MKKQGIQYLILGLLMVGVFIVISNCDTTTPENSIFDTFQDEAFTTLTLETDISKLRNRTDEGSYQKAKITFLETDSTRGALKIKVKPRGVTRKRICGFPPLKLKFSKSDLEQFGLKEYATLKLVIPCQDGDDYEQILFKEYLAYKMYNLLTEKSFRVKLVKINFKDSKSLNPTFTYPGFIIEHNQQLADRLQANLLNSTNEPVKWVDDDQYQLFTLFQYMVGNTDWNLSNQHNLKILTIKESKGPAPVPYDFDFSGLVDAPYAEPYPTLPINDVKERLFQYRSKKATDFCPTIDLFISKKSEILALFNRFEPLEPTMKKEALLYLESFFELIEAPKVESVTLKTN